MSTSVAAETSLKAHTNPRRISTHMDATRSLSSSPGADDQNSSVDFEEELKQELENEMSASYDNLFGDDSDDGNDAFSDTRSVTGISTVDDLGSAISSDNEVEANNDNVQEDATRDEDDDEEEDDDEDDDDDLFGDGGTLESGDEDDELNLDFEDPLVPDVAKAAQNSHFSTNDTNTKVDEDSASDDEFEAVDFDLDTLQAELEDSLVESATQNTSETRIDADSVKRKRVQNLVHVGDTDILERYKEEHPSLILHLFDSHFRFEGQEGVFLYNGPMRFFFEALNVGQIPIDLVDVLAQVNCRYFDGCLIVEVHDHRRPTQEPKTKKQRVSNLLTWSSFSNSSTPDTSNRIPPSPSTNPSETAKIPEPGSTAINGLKVDGAQRPAAALTNGTVTDGELASETPVNSSPDANSSKVYKKVMRPTSETINLDLLLACERSRTKLSPDDVLELESMVLLAIEEPLDLEPDVQVSRVSNAIRFVEYGHLLPSKRRKYNSAEIEAEQAEREEKLKLLTLMDDRKSREFQPSFNRVSQVNEWRHKKYVNDAEVYPAAVPSVSLGKKPPTKKNRSQMSLFSDGRRVIRTLRFVQTTSGRSTHTVFHVLELPDNNGLQGIMRWGTLPDTSINGGSRTFSFPNEEIMRMHIDNFKLLLGIENNRLIYDSIYPNGVPTSGPPPTSPTVAAPSTLNGASSSAEAPVSASVSVSSPTVTNAPVSSVSPSKAASPTTETESQSPIVAASSPTASETPKQKSASAAKNSIRNSRIKSPQPKQKKSASNNKDSTEPEDKASREKSASVGAQKAKSTGSTKSKSKSKSSAASQDTKPPSKDADADKDTQDAREITSTDSVKDTDDVGDRDNTPASSLQTDQASAEPEALKYAINTEPDNTSAATTGKKAQAKGGAKTQRKKAAPKEKKSKVKPKSAGAKGAKDATSKSKAGDVESASPVPATGDAENIAAGDGQNAAKQNINTSQGVTSAAANGNLLSMSPMVSNANIPAQSQAAAVSQTSLLNAALGLSSQTNPSAQAMPNMPFELPKHITKEYLQANPHYYAILRNHMTALVKQKQQQQQAGMPNVGSPNPLGSPQMRPGVPLNAATVAQMFQAMQGANEASSNGAGGVGAGSPANASASSANMSAAIGSIPPGDTPTLVASPVGMATSQAPPGFTSPAMRPNTMPPNAAAVPPGLQNLAPTKEEIILIQNYCRLFEVPFQNIQAPQLAMLIRLAKTGELRQAIMSRLQTISHNHQSANTGGNRTMANSSNSHSNATDSANLRQQQPQHFVNATTSVQSSPVVSSALPMNAGGAGLPGNPASSNAQTTNPMQLPPELANLPPTEKIKLLEAFIQRQRAVAMNNPGAHIQGPATSASQQALQAAIALQQQRNAAAGGGSLGATTSGAVANPATLGTQAPAMRPMRPNPGATATMQPRPLAAMMGSPTPAPSVPGSAPMGLPTGQQLLQQAALANMNPQQRQEFIQRIHQMQQMQQQQQHQQQQQQQQQPPQAAAAPRPQINMAVILQQFLAGHIPPTSLPPNVILFFLQNAQAQMSSEQRQTLQRLLTQHIQAQQNNAAAAAPASSAGPIRPGGTT